jgi:hypothetical protein
MKEDRLIEDMNKMRMTFHKDSKAENRVRRPNNKEFDSCGNKSSKLFELMKGCKYIEGKRFSARSQHLG